jgi:hypothetical protein
MKVAVCFNEPDVGVTTRRSPGIWARVAG